MSVTPDTPVKVIGCRWCPRTYAVTTMLSCNLVPFELDAVESPDEAADILGGGQVSYDMLPVVLTEAVTLFNPAELELAELIGLQTQPSSSYCDLLIVGGGPAGLSAAVYGASEGLKVTLLERGTVGGQAGLSALIENYLGFSEGVAGAALAGEAVKQAGKFGAEIVSPRTVCSIEVKGNYKVVALDDDAKISCRALLLAMGVTFRRLEAPGVEELVGAGVYYSPPMSEALQHHDDEVFIVGGANSAGQAAVALAGRCRHVTLIVRAAALEERMSRYLVDSIAKEQNITVRLESEVGGARGSDRLEELCIRSRATGESEWLPACVLYCYIGAEPHSDCLGGVVDLDKHGFILTGRGKAATLQTSVPGVFAAGDIRSGSAKRVATAVGEGSMAISQIHAWLANGKAAG